MLSVTPFLDFVTVGADCLFRKSTVMKKNGKEKGREGGQISWESCAGLKSKVTKLKVRVSPRREETVQAGGLQVSSSGEGESCALSLGGQYGGCGEDSGSLLRSGTATLEKKDDRRRSRALE